MECAIAEKRANTNKWIGKVGNDKRFIYKFRRKSDFSNKQIT